MSMSAPGQMNFEEGSLVAADHFRVLMDAMARPGKVFDVPAPQQSVDGLNSGAVMALLALCDHETPVWLHNELGDDLVVDFLRFHCGCPLVDIAKQAMFAVLPSDFDTAELGELSLGSPAYPDRSTTLIVQVDSLAEAGAFRLSGPGIKSSQAFNVDGLTSDFWKWRADNNKNFPLGVDVILVTNDSLAALPRTTQVREIT